MEKNTCTGCHVKYWEIQATDTSVYLSIWFSTVSLVVNKYH